MQPISILFCSFFSSISPLLAFSAREWTFHFPSSSCQTLLWCILTHLFSPKTLESAHTLKKGDQPRVSLAENPETRLRGTRRDMIQKSMQGSKCCWKTRVIWHCSQSAALSCLQPTQRCLWWQQTLLYQSGRKRVQPISCAKIRMKRQMLFPHKKWKQLPIICKGLVMISPRIFPERQIPTRADELYQPKKN